MVKFKICIEFRGSSDCMKKLSEPLISKDPALSSTGPFIHRSLGLWHRHVTSYGLTASFHNRGGHRGAHSVCQVGLGTH